MSTPLAYHVEGAGAPVALFNGGMMTFASWQPIAARLAADRRVLRFDFRGQLLSPGEPPPDLAGHAADAVDLLDQLGFADAHLIGASFGALVALELAAARPERVRSLTLVTAMDRATPTFRAQSDVMRALLAGIHDGSPRERFWDVLVDRVYSAAFRRREADALVARRAQLDLLPAAWFEGVDRLLAAVEAFDLTSRLPLIRKPALVVTAGDDRVMAAERSRALAAELGAETAHHPGAGHALVAEDPEWLALVIEGFLVRQERTRP